MWDHAGCDIIFHEVNDPKWSVAFIGLRFLYLLRRIDITHERRNVVLKPILDLVDEALDLLIAFRPIAFHKLKLRFRSFRIVCEWVCDLRPVA